MRSLSSLPYIVTAKLATRMRHDLQLLCIGLLGGQVKAVTGTCARVNFEKEAKTEVDLESITFRAPDVTRHDVG